jgi:curved DNA-binding protein
VERNATEGDIKKAYRKLTRENHPDLQPKEKKEETERKFKLKIPRDARDGKKIRLKGQGGEAEPGGEQGDLYLKIKVLPYKLFLLRGDDLEEEVVIYLWQATLGAKISVTALDGSVRVTVPPRTHAGNKLRLRGKGMPRKDGGHGDRKLKG